MPLCARHERPANKYSVCDQCDIDQERAERDRQRDAKELEKLRDRCALHYSAVLLNSGEAMNPSEIAIEAYRLADAMLGARAVR